jgi:hypothetical protein
MRQMTPIPHHRRDETVGVRRAKLGIQAVRTETTMAVRPKRAPSGAAQAFHLESRARHPLNLTGRGVRVQIRSTRRPRTPPHRRPSPLSTALWSSDLRAPAGCLF